MNSQELDDDEREIRDYVLDYPKKTENEVALAMQEKGQCHRLTALKKIGKLKERDIIEDIRPKQNSFSCLIVKDKNEFHRIYQQLTLIEKNIEMMYEPIRKLTPLLEQPQSRFLGQGYIAILVLPYVDSSWTMLRDLLFRSHDKVISKLDYMKLHYKIIRLLKKLTEQLTNLQNSSELMAGYKHTLESTRDTLKTESSNKNYYYDISMVNTLIKTIVEFERHFLN